MYKRQITGRSVSFETRGIVALAGTFGYELDITKLPEKERQQIPKQVAQYKQYNRLIREGAYYRIASWQENHLFDSYMVVSEDKTEALLTYIQVAAEPNKRSRRIRLQGLLENAFYEAEGRRYRGDTLMYAGLLMEPVKGDMQARLISIRQVS